MHFEIAHEFSASRGDVAAVLCDPGFHTGLDLPDLGRPEVVADSTDGSARLLRLRYEYIGELDPIARKIMGNRKLTWIQELRLDTQTYAGTLTFAAEADARRLNGAATVVIETFGDALGGERCRRRISGDFHVRVPLVGGTAEKRIVPGLLRRLDVEAAALSNTLTG